MKKQLKITTHNNLNAIKFVCAIFVIFHHCYPIAMGKDYVDPVRKITNLQFSFGNFSVLVFLFVAGLLITKSYTKSKNNKVFLLKRIKRLLPSLIIVIFLTVFIIGPIFTKLSLKEYFTNLDVYKYLVMNCLLITNHNLPVFLSNAYNLSPNGSLWTLPVEFLCYIGTIILGLLHLLNKKFMKYFPYMVIILNCMQFIFIKRIGAVWPALQAILFFLMGMSIYFNSKKVILNPMYFIISICVTIISIIFNVYSYVNIITIPYMILFLAFYFKNKISFLNELGKYSYEIYLLGFLIQQCIASLFPVANPYFNFFASLPFILILAFIVNKLVKLINKKILD